MFGLRKKRAPAPVGHDRPRSMMLALDDLHGVLPGIEPEDFDALFARMVELGYGPDDEEIQHLVEIGYRIWAPKFAEDASDLMTEDVREEAARTLFESLVSGCLVYMALTDGDHTTVIQGLLENLEVER